MPDMPIAHFHSVLRTLRIVLVILLTAGIVVFAGVVYWTTHPTPTASSPKAILEILQSEFMAFHVATLVKTEVAAQSDRGSIWLGPREGMIRSILKLYYGVDLSAIDVSDITITPEAIVVRLPAMTCLDAVVDMGSITTMSRLSGLQRLSDLVRDTGIEEQMRNDLANEVRELAADPKLRPNAEAVLANLNRRMSQLSTKLGKSVAFTWKDAP